MSPPIPSTGSPKPTRRRRWLWISLGAIGLAAAIAVALLLTPAVQGWMLKRYIASQPGWRLDFEKFGAGPRGVDIRGLDFGMPGVVARSAPIAIRIAPGRLFNKRELRVERVEARKLLVTVTPAEFPTKAEPFGGIMPLLQLPLAWALDEAALEGEIAIRQGGESVVVGAFQISGGGVSAEKAGEFTYDLTLNSALLPAGSDNPIRSHGTLSVAQDTNHGVERISIAGTLSLPRYGKLNLPGGRITLSVAKSAAGEEYHAHLELGSAAAFDLTGHVDPLRATFVGHVAAHADQSIANGFISDEKLPSVGLQANADLTYDLRRGDLDVSLTGDLDAHDWGKLAPELAVIDAAKGTLTTAIARHGGKLSLSHFAVTLRGATSAVAVKVDLSHPIDPLAPPTDPIATLSLEHGPVAWINPWLASSQIVIDPVELNGRWAIAFTSDHNLLFTPTRAIDLGSVSAHGSSLPPIPAVQLTLSPRLALSSARGELTIDDFMATTRQTDRVAANLTITHEFASQTTRATGALSGSMPTLLSGSAQSVPFKLDARWDISHSGKRLRASTLELIARKDARTTPCLTLQLLQPLAVDLDTFSTPPTNAAAEWARLTFNGFPLDWLSHWLRDRHVGGTIASGESVLRSTGDGQLKFVAVTPWQVANASLGIGGRTLFNGELRVAPNFERQGDAYAANLADLEAQDAAGNRIFGRIQAEARVSEKHAATIVDLEADLPALPHNAETFGPLHASLHAESHNESTSIAVVDALDLRVRNRDRELLALRAPQPFLFGLSNTGMFTAGTLAPLKLTTNEIPLAWTRPWLTGIEVGGMLQPAEFELTAQLTKFLLRPLKPVNVRGFSARVGNRDIAREMQFTVSPGLDLTLICIPRPKFQLAYSGTVHLTQGAVDLDGRRAIDVDTALSFVGNDTATLPSGIELTARADFAELSRIPALANRGLPARGTLVARLNGDMLGQAPLEWWSRLEGVPVTNGDRILPALEVFANGKVSRDQTFAAGVEMRFATLPQPSDAKFDVNLNLRDGKLDLASAFRSSFLDLGETLALAEAFQPRTGRVAVQPPPQPASLAPTRRLKPAASYPQLGRPFWTALRGHFDLEIGALQYVPYRIDRVHGRLDLRDRELVLSQLSGGMFAGSWSGDVRIDYQPENKTGDHALTGDFKITQFDSARVVQTVFPTELASIEARIDVHSTVRSRGNALFDLLDRAEGDFTVDGREGIVRLTVPKQEMAATAAVFGGAILLSPELRALGRLLKKFAEMPVDQLRISGERTASGDVHLNEFRIDSPQARILANGRIPAAADQPLMNRPLELSIDLAAKDEMAVILGGMSLIEKKPRADGYRALKEKFVISGKAGEPDTRPLYDLLAKAVIGSKGTWGFLMRKVQDQVNKLKTSEPKKSPPVSAGGAIP